MPQSERTRQWDDSQGRNDPTRWLTADVLVERDQRRWVLDAKYKTEFGNESRSDRFQMCAYAIGFNAERVSLVYPTSLFHAQRRILLETTFGLKQIVIESISLPMHAGPTSCKDALVTIGQSVEQHAEYAALN
jgi:5-methylcytosine-specific restriction endonuclease McrBC regulatory subunit McrC